MAVATGPMVVRTKRGDTKCIFVDTLKVNGVAVDLTGSSVRFIMRRVSKPAKIVNQAADITSPVTGDVQYEPIDEDVDTEGKYEQEWEVTFPSTRKLTFPNADPSADAPYNTVLIARDLGDAP